MKPLERLGFQGSGTPKVKISKRELEICDLQINKCQAKIQTWEFFDMVESKEMAETSKKKNSEKEKKQRAENQDKRCGKLYLSLFLGVQIIRSEPYQHYGEQHTTSPILEVN